MSSSVVRTLGQKRAEYALKQIMEYHSISELKNFSAGVPTMILQNGLGHTMAFCYTRRAKNKQHDAILKIIEGWIQKHPSFKATFEDKSGKDFLLELAKIDQKRYLDVQQETLALLEWVKRYAKAFIDDQGKNT